MKYTLHEAAKEMCISSYPNAVRSASCRGDGSTPQRYPSWL